MPRKLRVEYPGAIYHVMRCGNGRQNIFRGDVDRQDFLKTLAGACEKTGFQVQAYCLTRNHFHLVVETPNGNLVAGMKWFLGASSSIVPTEQSPLDSSGKSWCWRLDQQV